MCIKLLLYKEIIVSFAMLLNLLKKWYYENYIWYFFSWIIVDNCHPTHGYLCKTGACIPRRLVCDTVNNCEGYEPDDEANCPLLLCKSFFYIVGWILQTLHHFLCLEKSSI